MRGRRGRNDAFQDAPPEGERNSLFPLGRLCEGMKIEPPRQYAVSSSLGKGQLLQMAKREAKVEKREKGEEMLKRASTAVFTS